jgi:FSR family fosmidomycin resistance protein-like MFS transporter
MKYRLALLSAGHLVTDVNQGALPALLPFLISEYHLSYAAAGVIIFSTNIVSTIVQPLFGYLADRVSSPWLMPAGIVLAGVGMGATGVVSGYGWVLVCVMVSGIGVAAFHPQGALMVDRIPGERKASAMSLFGIGGTIGIAVGPVIITPALLVFGLRGTLVLVIPVSILAAVLVHERAGRDPGHPRTDRRPAVPPSVREDWSAFARLTGVVVARAVLSYGFYTYLPLYWINVLHQSKVAGALTLTLFALSGVAGNLLGGRLADRWGYTRVTIVGFCAQLPLVPLLLIVSTPAMALPLVVLIGGCIAVMYSPSIVLGQRYLPRHTGLSSGVTLGVAVSIGGVAIPILGRVADHSGLGMAFAVLGIVPAVAAGLAWSLPEPRLVLNGSRE